MKKDTQQKDIRTVQWIYTATKGQRLRLLTLVGCDGLEALLSVWFALVCKALIDGAAARDRQTLIISAGLLLGTILLEILSGLVSGAVTEKASAALSIFFQDSLLASLLKNDYSKIVSYHSGELMNRMVSDVGIVVSGILQLVPSAAYLVLRLLGAVGVLTVLAPGFTLLFLAAGLMICVVMLLLRGKFKHLHKQVQEAGGAVRSCMQEALSSLLVIRVFGAEKPVREQAMERQEEFRQARKKRWMVNMLGGMGLRLVFQLGYFLAMVWGCAGIFHGTLTYGTLTATLQLVNQIQGPFAGFSGLVSQYYAVLASAERLMELAQLPEETPAEMDRDEFYENLRSISFEHVDFTYGRNAVLEDVCAVIPKGEITSITGISGGGKSTLFLLLLGAYLPTSGEILVETTQGERRPFQSSKGLFAYVPQGNYLFSGTLRENVTFLRRDVPEERIWEALRLSCAEDFVRELPQGLDTPLGEKGHGLSEGQMQRIAIARAILSEAPILLLDEATSALDEAAEAQLLRNIQSLQNRTCLVVTHRKAALAICKRHLVLDNGKITERGI